MTTEQLSIEEMIAHRVTAMVMSQLRDTLNNMEDNVQRIMDVVGAADEKILKAGDVVELLGGCNYETLKRWGDSEGLPFKVSGTQRLYARSAVLAWLRQSRSKMLVAKVEAMRKDRAQSENRQLRIDSRKAKWAATAVTA
jgi:hypothetical protein